MDIDVIASFPKSTWPTMVMMVILLLKTKASQTWPMLGLSETEVCLRREERGVNVKLDVHTCPTFTYRIVTLRIIQQCAPYRMWETMQIFLKVNIGQ